MATALQEYRYRVVNLIDPDGSSTELTDSQVDEHIKAALERYSRDAPDEITADITGDGGKFYGVTSNLTSWVEGFSYIKEIEYPAATVASDETPVYLEDGEWRDDYFDGATRYLFFENHNPTASETIRVTYAAPYTFNVSNQTDAPAQDFYAICSLAACLACRAIATKYSRTSDSTINADSVNHTSRANEFSRRAKEYCADYSEHMGLADGDERPFEQAAGDFVDWDTAPGWPLGREFLYHDRRTR